MEVATAAAGPALVAEPRRQLALVRCDKFRCLLTPTACAIRCTARWPSGRRQGAPRFPPCAGCRQGAGVVARLMRAGWTPPPRSQPAELLGAVQRAARGRWLRSFPVYAEPVIVDGDPLADAASTSPDDRGEPADLG